MARRNTIQRALVLEAVKTLHCHATADEVYEEIIKEHPTISKATVYRNLNLLSEMGEIRRLEIPGLRTVSSPQSSMEYDETVQKYAPENPHPLLQSPQ